MHALSVSSRTSYQPDQAGCAACLRPTNVAAFGWAKFMLSLSSSVCRASRIVLCENTGFRTCDVQAATCTSFACGTRSGSVASSSCFKRVELCPVANTCTKRKGHVLNKAYRVGGECVICEISKASSRNAMIDRAQPKLTGKKVYVCNVAWLLCVCWCV